MKAFLVVSYEVVMQAIFSLPRYPLFNSIKSMFLSCMGANIGKRVIYYPGVWIEPGRNFVVGDDVDFALGVQVSTEGGVTIGDRVLIGYGTKIFSSNHVVPPMTERIFNSGAKYDPVRIANDVWIGSNCIILPGVTIGEGAVIAAGSVVTRSVGRGEMVAGVPARLIRNRPAASADA